jgi:low affinity Fe/Cu permease
MSKYNVYIVAYPSDCSLEEKIDEMLMNDDTDAEVYVATIENIEMNNVSENLTNYLKNGFKEEEENV